jgi:non-ribosomal peptide synthetase component F
VVCVAQNIRWTYAHLDQLSNQLARYLSQHHDVGSGKVVGLFIPRSAHMLMAILAILKTGSAYVPIDPECPPERSAFILQDANAKVMLTWSTMHLFEKNEMLKSQHSFNVTLRSDDQNIETVCQTFLLFLIFFVRFFCF